MKVNLKNNNINLDVSIGDLIVTENKEMYLIIKNSDAPTSRFSVSNKYRLLNVNSSITLTPSFSTLSEVVDYLKKYNIVKVIKSENLELVENEPQLRLTVTDLHCEAGSLRNIF